MPKFKLLRDLLVQDGVISEQQLYQPGRPPRDWLELIHDADYVTAYCDGGLDEKAQRRIGLPWSEALVRRTCTAVGGTILTAKLALNRGIACNTAGGTHHAFPGHGAGFCIFNDIAIATRLLQSQTLINTVLIIDLDVHQGDGNAWIFRNDPRVFTFSMHCAVNFPSRKQISDLDVPLDEGTEDEDYLAQLAAHLPDLLTQLKPDLIFYDAGADPHRDDRLGKLALSDNGLYRRDQYVLETCAQGRFPVACVIGGGYSKDMNALIYRHSYLHRAASEVYRKYY